MTHCIPIRHKITFQSSLALENGGVRDAWNHQSIRMSHLFLKLSIVRILPNVAIQEKNATLKGASVFHMLFQGKEVPLLICFNLKCTISGRNPI